MTYNLKESPLQGVHICNKFSQFQQLIYSLNTLLSILYISLSDTHSVSTLSLHCIHWMPTSDWFSHNSSWIPHFQMSSNFTLFCSSQLLISRQQDCLNIHLKNVWKKLNKFSFKYVVVINHPDYQDSTT